MKTTPDSPRIFRVARTFKLDADTDLELRRVCGERRLRLSDYVNNALRATLGLSQAHLEAKGDPHQQAAAAWLALEPWYRQMLQWWPEVGRYYRLDELIRVATPVTGPDGVPDRARDLHTALRGMCRCGTRLDGLTPGKLGAVLRYWRGHWRDGRAVQRGDAGWGVVAREGW